MASTLSSSTSVSKFASVGREQPLRLVPEREVHRAWICSACFPDAGRIHGLRVGFGAQEFEEVHRFWPQVEFRCQESASAFTRISKRHHSISREVQTAGLHIWHARSRAAIGFRHLVIHRLIRMRFALPARAATLWESFSRPAASRIPWLVRKDPGVLRHAKVEHMGGATTPGGIERVGYDRVRRGSLRRQLTAHGPATRPIALHFGLRMKATASVGFLLKSRSPSIVNET